MSDNPDQKQSSTGPIVLLTDFGASDPFAGQMKGVIAGIMPYAHVIDLCHEVPPLNIIVAGVFLDGSWRYFPSGSIFVVVVDPGVGTDRNAVILKAHDRYFVSPDNGCIWPVVQKDIVDEGEIVWEAVKIENPDYMLPEISDTFHGRDIFAPAAAHLLAGVPMESFGSKIDSLIPLDVARPELVDDGIHGKIIHIDHFGNAWTNIHRSFLDRIGWLDRVTEIVTRVASCRISGMRRTYLTDDLNKPIALINSFGLVEIAWPGQSAKEKMRLWEGVWVDLTLKS